jgi:hypothetical protein
MRSDEIEMYKQLSSKVVDLAEGIRTRYIKLMEEVFVDNYMDFEGRSALFTHCFMGCDGHELVWQGDEFWKFTLPLDYLTNPNWETEAREEMEAHIRHIQNENRKQSERDAEEEIRRLRQLREKYPNA